MGRGDRGGQDMLLAVGPSVPVGDELEEGKLLLDGD